MAEASVSTRTCTRCLEEKSFAALSKAKKGRFGLRSTCKRCDVVAIYARAAAEPSADKRCTECGLVKPASEFYRQSTSRDGLVNRCKPCHKGIRTRLPDYRQAVRKAKAQADGRVYRTSEDRRAAKEAAALKREAQRAARATEMVAAKQEALVRRLLREKIKNQIKKRRRLGHIDWRIRDCLIRDRWSPTILKRLGYTVAELKAHIERQFGKGMDWRQFASGAIHIDHIVPVRSFDLTKDEEIKACWAMTNLRPMWAAQNIAKGGERTHLL